MSPLKRTITCPLCGNDHYFLQDFSDKILYSKTTALCCGDCGKECWWGSVLSIVEKRRSGFIPEFVGGLDAVFTEFDSFSYNN